jgi:MFS family permease
VDYWSHPTSKLQTLITRKTYTDVVLQAAANGVALLCVGRVVGGWAIGVCSAIVPVYQSEIAPKEIRGRVVSLQQWAITWGILIQYVSQLFNQPNTSAWVSPDSYEAFDENHINIEDIQALV